MTAYMRANMRNISRCHNQKPNAYEPGLICTRVICNIYAKYSILIVYRKNAWKTTPGEKRKSFNENNKFVRKQKNLKCKLTEYDSCERNVWCQSNQKIFTNFCHRIFEKDERQPFTIFGVYVEKYDPLISSNNKTRRPQFIRIHTMWRNTWVLKTNNEIVWKFGIYCCLLFSTWGPLSDFATSSSKILSNLKALR